MLQQTFFLPLILILAGMQMATFISDNAAPNLHTNATKNHLMPLFILLVWLISTFWIIGLPHIPPLQASDNMWWLMVAGTLILVFTQGRKQCISLVTLTVCSVILTIWPVLTHSQGWASQLVLCFELLVFLSLSLIILFGSSYTSSNHVAQKHPATRYILSYVILTAICGAVAVISGSVTLALLCFSLASCIGIAGVIAKYHTFTVFNQITSVVWLSLVLQIWQFVEVNALTTVSLLISKIMLFEQGINVKRYLYLGILSLIIGLGYLGYLELYIAPSGYY